jgi:hypothetical protein
MTWWKLEKTDENAYRLGLELDRVGLRRRVLLLADVHWDSAHCRLDLLRDCLEEAKATGSPVVIAGDFFDAMQGKWDPRASQDALREEHRGGAYLDLLVSTAAEWLKPYAANLAVISYGNHETSIKKRHEVDLLQRLCQELRRMGSPVECGPYWGYLVVVGTYPNGNRDNVKICWHHGHSGGGEVSRGINQHAVTRSQYEADVYLSGHIHRRNLDENVMTRVTARGNVRKRRQLFLRASCWKDESHDGWHVQQGRAARPIGGWWLEIEAIKHKATYKLDYRALPT